MKYKMRLHDEPFQLIKSGIKTIEMRLNDEKRRVLKEEDIIEFQNRFSHEILQTKIVKIHHFSSFDELYQFFDPECLGYLNDEIANPKDMEVYYPKDKQKKYGVLGIEIKKNHS